ncbi:hypothetical protein OIU78_002521, partial [Salix suchowensis]
MAGITSTSGSGSCIPLMTPRVFRNRTLLLLPLSHTLLPASSSPPVTVVHGPTVTRGLRGRVISDDEQALDISRNRSATVRLIDQQQTMVGVLSVREAVQMAEDAELDLVIVSPDADPPVVKIMDY